MAFRTPTTAASINGVDTLDVSKPSGTVESDIIVITFTGDAVAITNIASTGFTALEGSVAVATPDGHAFGLLWKRAGASEPSAYTVTWLSQTPDAALACFAVSGRHLTNPPVHTTATNTSSNASPVTITATGVTALDGDDLLWIALPDVTGGNTATSFTPPSGYTEIVDAVNLGASNWCNIGAAKKENVSAGATGGIAGDFTMSSGAAGWCAFLVRIPARVLSTSGFKNFI